MLILSGRVNERIRVTLPDGRVGWITLVSVLSQTARLGFELPRDVDLRREELLPEGERYPGPTTEPITN